MRNRTQGYLLGLCVGRPTLGAHCMIGDRRDISTSRPHFMICLPSYTKSSPGNQMIYIDSIYIRIFYAIMVYLLFSFSEQNPLSLFNTRSARRVRNSNWSHLIVQLERYFEFRLPRDEQSIRSKHSRSSRCSAE